MNELAGPTRQEARVAEIRWGTMYRCQERYDALFGFDRELADGLFELNELRRSRSLAQYEPTTTNARVLPRWSRAQQRLRCRRARRA